MPRFRAHQPQKTALGAPAIQTWLARANGIEVWWPSLQRQSVLQTEIDCFCQQQQCGQFLVRERQQFELVILAKTASQAAKMRNLQTSLLLHLAQQSWHFTRITVRIQPEHFLKQALSRSGLYKKILPGSCLASWQKLSAELPPGRLQEAVQQLLQRRHRHLEK